MGHEREGLKKKVPHHHQRSEEASEREDQEWREGWLCEGGEDIIAEERKIWNRVPPLCHRT